ncbi:uncharacterized protein [Typha latifolia]|uniref:uncharacterized protein n=1 Tax=Typha latifolia TaxID=4733 RepID=UPI003C30E99B
MKREGWKHGMNKGVDVGRRRSLFHARANYKPAEDLESSPATGVLQPQLLLKPTNSSKFTGKCRKARCRSCHYHPVSKSRDKAKGEYKLKSCDVALNHRLVSWRVVDEGSTLSGNCRYDDADEEEEDDNDHDIEYGGQSMEPDSFSNEEIIHVLELESEELMKPAEEDEQTMDDSEEDDDMDFYKVGIAWEYTDEDDWLVLQEI